MQMPVFFVRMNHSGGLDIFIAIEDIENWRVIALRAMPPSEGPDGPPTDFIGIIHAAAAVSLNLTAFALKRPHQGHLGSDTTLLQ